MITIQHKFQLMCLLKIFTINYICQNFTEIARKSQCPSILDMQLLTLSSDVDWLLDHFVSPRTFFAPHFSSPVIAL